MKLLFRALLLAMIGFALLWWAGFFRGSWFDDQVKRVQYAAEDSGETIREVEIGDDGEKQVRVYKAGSLTGGSSSGGGNESGETDVSSQIGDLVRDAIDAIKSAGQEPDATPEDESPTDDEPLQSSLISPRDLVLDEQAAREATPAQDVEARQVPASPEAFVSELKLQINTYREEQGLGDLAPDTSLDDLANTHSQLVADGELPYEGGFSTRSDSSGRVLCVENFALDYATPAGLLAAWQGSALQNENLLKKNLTRYGVAVRNDVITLIVCR